jgi:hypothetical protein
MKVVVITSCTGEKTVSHSSQLTLADFQAGPEHVRMREAELGENLVGAEKLYSGQQHLRLMRGVEAFRSKYPSNGAGSSLNLQILSAGYGLVSADKEIAPYEATFQGMKSKELESWASQLQVAASLRRSLDQPYDMGLVLLGDSYLKACRLNEIERVGGPTLLLCGKNAAGRIPRIANLKVVVLTNAEAKRFSCGLVALKGEMAAQILCGLAASTFTPMQLVNADEPLDEISRNNKVTPRSTGRIAATANPDVDRVISLPSTWHHKPHREKLNYFIPEWDDLVDGDFDFENDIHSGGGGDWSNEVYAHQLYPEPNYDGILISKVVAEKSKKKRERINRLGVHRYLRVPREFPIMGDCGAFGYIQETVPPYSTDEILDYYTRLDFDMGVSIDHLIVSATESVKQERYGLTIANADEFLKEHKKAKLPWTPIGAVQGWDPKSYAAAAKDYVAMGYQYIGIGGLVRSSTKDVLELLTAVHEVVPSNVKIHLFGLARIDAMKTFSDLGVSSVDSASLLRRAWMGTGQNYLSIEGKFFTAIRIPEANKSFRAKRMVTERRASSSEVEKLERISLHALHEFDAGRKKIEEVLDAVEEYDRLITPDRDPTRDLIRETLEAAPWKTCPCDICRRDGIEVVIFRGNNRNRRRGFHNTYVFYRLLQKVLAGEAVSFKRKQDQLNLFGEPRELSHAV